jgi:hypothetical protein
MGREDISQGRERDNSVGYVSEYPGSSESAYSEDGVDLTLIRWMLSLTPTERLKVLQDNISAIQRLRNAGIRTADHKNSSDS